MKTITFIFSTLILTQGLFAIEANAVTVIDSINQESQSRKICNISGEDVSVALGYQDGVSKGWVTVSNGRCFNPPNHPVHGVAMYFYGQTVQQRWSRDGSRSFCISNRRFEIDSTGGCFNGAESRFFGSIGNGVTLKLNVTFLLHDRLLFSL
jgi:uncharacterized membrane protein